MWNLSKILSAIWGFAGATALITLFAVYANFNAPVDLGPLDVPFLINKQRFFAIFSGLYLSVNLITFVATRTIGKGKKVRKSILAAQQLPLLVALKIMVIGANTFLIILMMHMKSELNVGANLESWQWVVIIIGPLMVIAGLLYLLSIVINSVKQR